MTFLNPWVLLGLAASSIPLILHLLNLRKLRTIEFSTLRFLKELQKTRIRRLKLKQIILLILRTAIIIFAVLAFSRPAIEGSVPGFESYAKTSAVIIIDNSFSMDISDELGNRFNQAKRAAASIMSGLKDGDEAALITMANPETQQSYTLSRNFSFLKEALGKIKIANTSARLMQSLRLADHLLEDAANINREVFIITDEQKNILQDDIKDSLKLFKSKTTVFVVKTGAGAKADVQNISIDSVNVITRIFQPGKPVQADAMIRNGSSRELKGVVVSLAYNNDRVAQRSVDLPSHEQKAVTIAASPQNRGLYRAMVEIEGDALDVDNRRYFGFIIPENPKVALVGTTEKLNFLSIVLGSSGQMNSIADARRFSPDEFSGLDLASYDIIICAGGPYRQSDLVRLTEYVKNGGSALIFADDATNGTDFKNALYNMGFGNSQPRSFSESQPAQFTSVDKIHPIFEGVFKGTTDSRQIVESPKITQAITVDGGLKIIDMPGGAFLSESKPGEGKVLYCAVSPVLSWSSFPLTGLFPTIIYRSIAYLTTHDGLGISSEAEKPVIMNLPKKFSAGGNFKVVDPTGTEYYKQAAVMPSGAVLTLDNLNQLGVYIIETAEGKPVSLVAVNPPASESVLSFFTDSELKKSMDRYLGKNVRLEFLDSSRNVFSDVVKVRTGTELWQFFILLAILCALAEMIVEKNTKSETVTVS